MISQGDFKYDNYSNDHGDKWLLWTSFLMATFLLIVVFMNMLIAIMGETFAQVQEIKQEAALKEQVKLMEDFIWLVDLRDKFRYKRHIIRLTPDIR